MNVLLVEPAFPVPAGRPGSAYLPIGLLKIASYHRAQKDQVVLVRSPDLAPFYPDEIKVTSLFTYWSRWVWDSVAHYRAVYPKARIEVGGIYASLMPEHCAQSGCDEVAVGLYRGGVAEDMAPAYDLVDSDFQVIHASRGCIRRCAFCGVWRVEPKSEYRESIVDLIVKPRIVFYDNNLLANPHVADILCELGSFRFKDGRRVSCECQCGLDTRLLTPDLALALKKARFRTPRISWDGAYSEWKRVRAAMEMLETAGYERRNTYVFMLYNHDVPYSEMREKLEACRRWGLRVADCRYRPLDAVEDGYRPGPKPQSPHEYYTRPGWTDSQVRRFRRAVRQQNIAIMLRLPNNRYAPGCEQHLVGTPWWVTRKADAQRSRDRRKRSDRA